MMDGWGHGLFGGVWMLLFWGAVIGLPLLLVWLVLSRRSGGAPSPRDILEQRYARGEIGDEEYERRKRTLDER